MGGPSLALLGPWREGNFFYLEEFFMRVERYAKMPYERFSLSIVVL